MNVQKFVEKYNGFNNKTLRDSFLNERINPTYILFNEKYKECNRIAKMTTHDVSGYNTDYQKVIFKENTNTRYMLFSMQIVKWYTDIEISDDTNDYQKFVDEFHMLEEYSLIEMILLLVTQKTSKTMNIDGEDVVISNEVDRVQQILDACVHDIELNENNIINYLDTKIESLGLVFNTLVDSVLSMFSDTLKANINEEDISALKEILAKDNVVQFSKETTK